MTHTSHWEQSPPTLSDPAAQNEVQVFLSYPMGLRAEQPNPAPSFFLRREPCYGPSDTPATPPPRGTPPLVILKPRRPRVGVKVSGFKMLNRRGESYVGESIVNGSKLQLISVELLLPLPTRALDQQIFILGTCGKHKIPRVKLCAEDVECEGK